MHLRRAPLILPLVALNCAVLFAQQSTPVTIRVTDQAKAAIPHAQVRLVPSPDALPPKLETDVRGQFSISLQPGSYEFFVSAQGFKTTAQCIDTSIAAATPATAIPIVLRVGDTGSPTVLPEHSLFVSVHLSDVPVHPPITLSTADLKALPHVSLTVHNPHTNADEAYSGVSVTDLLVKGGAPPIKSLHGRSLAAYLLATGSDGYQAVIAIGELDPTLGSATILVADSMDGKPLDAKTGPFRLVVGGDKRPARSVHNLVSLDLKSAP